MIKYSVTKPGRALNGVISLSPTKSVNYKFLVFRILKSSTLTQHITTESEDSRILDKGLINEGIKKNRGTSAKAIRHIRAFIGYFGGEWVMSSSNTIKGGTFVKIAKVLQKFGLNVSHEEHSGKPPYRISGRNLKGQILRVDSFISSKVIEAKLLLSPSLSDEAIQELRDSIVRLGYVDMTLKALQYLGVNTDWKPEEVLVDHEYSDGSQLVVEQDWSMASYWYEIVALAQKGSMEIQGLNYESFQNESAVKDIFRELGVETQAAPELVRLKRKGRVAKKFAHDFSSYPDLIPATVATCVCMGIPFRISGIDSLRLKEPDRVESLQAELAKVGASLTTERHEGKEVLMFDGKTRLKGLKQLNFDTHNDHRMALTLSPICLTGVPVTLENPRVTNKSYTTFWDDLRRVGFEVV